jgi:predicted ATPase with chaperone activity
MFIGDILVGLGLVTQDDVAAALDIQQAEGGALTDRLIELGGISAEQLEAATALIPSSPHTVAETGLPQSLLLNLLMKAMYASGLETPSQFCQLLKLPQRAVLDLLEDATQHQLLSVLGSAHSANSELRYALTTAGMEWAHSAMRQNEYVGPAPVPLAAFREQILRQRITNEMIDQPAIESRFSDLVISDELVTKIGPAINSGRSILFYGPPGNGKTSLAERIGALFTDIIYVPHCFEVDGQIVKVFDPGLHRPIDGLAGDLGQRPMLHCEDYDQRWIACRRPIIFTGGELTLEMLDLGYFAEAKFYEAPLHIKALNGVFLIDDFGRQLVKPEALLNRWIVPLESRVDYMKLHSGKSFSLPFDELLIFSTNLSPKDLMDAAFLRRIPYKIEIAAPSAETYRDIFKRTAEKAGIVARDDVVDHVIAWIRERADGKLAGYQPRFIIDQVLAACRFAHATAEFQPRFLAMALSNLHAQEGPPAVDVVTRIPRPRANGAPSRPDPADYAALSAAAA